MSLIASWLMIKDCPNQFCLPNIFIIHLNKFLFVYIHKDCFLARSFFHKNLVEMSKTTCIHVFVNKRYLYTFFCMHKNISLSTVKFLCFKERIVQSLFCLSSTHLSNFAFIFILLSIHIRIYLKKKVILNKKLQRCGLN